MTLPQPDKPDIDDKFRTIISDINENLVFLDATYGVETKVITFTRDLTAASGTVGYTGVGFQPTAIILFLSEPTTGRKSWGVGDVDKTNHTLMERYDGTLSIRTTWIGQIWTTLDDVHRAKISSYDADGFTLEWEKEDSPTGTATGIALCIKGA